jgi:hypothetical protein
MWFQIWLNEYFQILYIDLQNWFIIISFLKTNKVPAFSIGFFDGQGLCNINDDIDLLSNLCDVIVWRILDHYIFVIILYFF